MPAEIKYVICPNIWHYSAFYTLMPQSSTTSIFYCQTPSSTLELLEFKAATCLTQNTVWDDGRTEKESEQFYVVGKQQSDSDSHFLWVCCNDCFFSPFLYTLCTGVIGITVTILCITKFLPAYLTPDLFLHLNVMLFKLSYSPLINNEWGLTVCLVKSSASNVSVLLKGAVDEGGKNLLHECASPAFGPAVLSKCLL